MDENSLAQLYDDYNDGINVLEGESVTDYITRMGGVNYNSKADGGIMVAIENFNQGGMAGNKTYHQFHDQYVPMDEESMGYAYGGGVGSMMQPRQNFAVGGGADFQPLGYDEDESITVEDFSESFSPPMYRPVRSVGGVKLKEMPAGVDQSGIIDSAPSITNRGVRTMEGSLIDGDDPSSRYGVQKDFAPSSVRGMNALERDIASVARNTTQEEFDSLAEDDFEEMRGIDFKDAPVSFMNRMNNPKVFDPIVNTKNFVQELPGKINSGITGVMDLMGKIPTPLNMIKNFANMRNPLNPNAKNYNPALAGQMETLTERGIIGVDPNTGIQGKIMSGPLAGKNLVSGFGTNDYSDMLEDKLGYFEDRIAFGKNYSVNNYKELLKEIAINKEIEKQKEIAAQEERDKTAALQAKVDAGTYMDRDRYGMTASDRAVGGGAGVASLGPSAEDRGSKSAQGYSQHAKGGIVSLRR